MNQVLKDPKENKEHLVNKDPKEPVVTLVLLATKALEEKKVPEDQRDRQDCLASKDTKDRKVKRESEVVKEKLEIRELKGSQATKDLWECRVRLDHQVFPVYPDLRDPMGTKDLLEPLVYVDHLESKDQLVP